MREVLADAMRVQEEAMNTRIARTVAKALRDLPGKWDSFNMYEWLREDIFTFATPKEEGEACGTVTCMAGCEVTPKSCTSDLWVSCAAQPSR